MEKRTFLKTLANGLLLTPLGINTHFDWKTLTPPKKTISDDFWKTVRSEYELTPDYINLEGGYYCITPQPTLNAFLSNVKTINHAASYYMRTRRFEDNLELRKELAQLAGTSTDEIVLTRNTTEGIDTVISGFDWKTGDEAIMAEQDYPYMLAHFDLMSRRHGLVKKVVSVPLHPSSDEEIVRLYQQAITPKTRLLMVCHIINITGQILPIRKIVDMAHAHGVEVLVDGAHSFAHLDFKIPDLGCDYYATSLHKWLSVPLGSGMLYVKKEKISKLWAMFGDNDYPQDDIRRLIHTGTPAVHTDITIRDAITYYKKIGAKRKEDRLRFIQEYWTSKVRHLPHVEVNTPAESRRACGIANVGITHIPPAELAKLLMEKYKIWTVAIDGAGVRGCRITPNIFTTTAELDTFVGAIAELAKK